MLPYITLGPLSLQTHQLCWTVLFLIAALWLRQRLKNIGVDNNHAYWLIFVTAFFGIAGAKMYGMLKYFVLHPESDIKEILIESGYGAYGLIVVGIGSAITGMKLTKLPVLKILDTSVPIMIFAVAFGRLACFLSGDGCYGPPTDLPWGMAFPHGLAPTFDKVHPTTLYEIIAIVPLSYAIFKIPNSDYRNGSTFLYFLFLSSGVRVFMEFFRSTLYPRILGMTVEQVIAILCFIVSGSLLYSLYRKSYVAKSLTTRSF